MEKLRNFPLKVYLTATGFVRDLKNDERGLSGVVVAVLLILVAVLAVILIWQLLGEQISTWWGDIVNKGNTITPVPTPP